MRPEAEPFATTLRQEGIPLHQAEKAAEAVLTTLAERISAGEARDLAARLPFAAHWLHTTTPAEAFDVEEFVRRVAQREAVPLPVAERHARAVFAALGRLVPADEIRDMTSELSRDYAPLIAAAEGRFFRLMSAETFFLRVGDRAGLPPDQARRATEAVLETLAERIAGGEVDDLIAHLPVELHAPLERGKASSGGHARRMSLEQFLERVAMREGVPPEQAREHARAVFATLRDAVPEQEVFDIAAQLPQEFAAVEAFPERTSA
jgi:uncharacterized protein (DUF2267 family)